MTWSPPFHSRPQDKAGAELLHDFCWATHQSREKGSPGTDRPPHKSGDLGLRTVTTSRGGAQGGPERVSHPAASMLFLEMDNTKDDIHWLKPFSNFLLASESSTNPDFS